MKKPLLMSTLYVSEESLPFSFVWVGRRYTAKAIEPADDGWALIVVNEDGEEGKACSNIGSVERCKGFQFVGGMSLCES